MSNVGWSVRVERNRLRFAAAHMATFAGDCEPLHGHNYAVALTVTGELAPDAWVIDFGRLKRIGREVCASLDHRLLLQMHSPVLQVLRSADRYDVAFGDRAYRFPGADVFELPADNSTAERIAEYIWAQVVARLGHPPPPNLMRLAVEVEEAPGQSATYVGEIM